LQAVALAGSMLHGWLYHWHVCNRCTCKVSCFDLSLLLKVHMSYQLGWPVLPCFPGGPVLQYAVHCGEPMDRAAINHMG
jgi:hypothetical protein